AVFRGLVAPIAQGALGVFQDVALVHQGHALAADLHRICDGAVHQALGSGTADRLEANADFDADVPMRRPDRLELPLPRRGRRLRAETNCGEVFWKLPLKEIQNFLSVARPGWI